MKYIGLVDQLSQRQKIAYIRTQRLVDRGLSITDAAKKAKVQVSDYNNARARLRQLDKTTTLIKTTLAKADRNVKAIPTKEIHRYLKLIERALTTFKRKIGV